MAGLTYESAFEKELLRLIDIEIGKKIEVMVVGGAIKSMEDYRRVQGVIDGLKLVVDLCQEANENVKKRSSI